jgi:thymidylate synthase
MRTEASLDQIEKLYEVVGRIKDQVMSRRHSISMWWARPEMCLESICIRAATA